MDAPPRPDWRARRERQAWEAAEGAVHALAELAAADPGAAAPLLPLLADAARVDHFGAAPMLRETVWRRLPDIARGVGKKVRRRPRRVVLY